METRPGRAVVGVSHPQSRPGDPPACSRLRARALSGTYATGWRIDLMVSELWLADQAAEDIASVLEFAEAHLLEPLRHAAGPRDAFLHPGPAEVVQQ